MRNFNILKSLAGIFTALLFINNTHAQIGRNFGLAYSSNMRGGIITVGNTVMNAVDTPGNTPSLVRMNEVSDPTNTAGGIGFSQYGNDQSDMKWIDIDGVSSTYNSSSANLSLPAGTNTIHFARIYWGGRMPISAVDSRPDTIKTIKLRKGNSGSYILLTAQEVITIRSADSLSLTYQAYADISNFIQINGSGTYTAANIPTTEEDFQGGQYGGWAISLAFQNPAFPYFSLRIYDGFAQVYNAGAAGSLPITLSGLNLPNSPLVNEDAIMGMVIWEGDASLAGDFIQVNNLTVSNTLNPGNNFFNGSVSRYNNYVTAKNPNYSNQMGIDIDEFYVGTGYNIQANTNTVNFLFNTTADLYFPGLFTFAIKADEPVLMIDKTVSDANGSGYADANEILTYTLSGMNMGPDTSYNTFIIDTLPSNITYVPGSLQVINAPGVTPGPKTDAAGDDQAFVGVSGGKTYIKYYIGYGATANAGGFLPEGTSSQYTVKFKARTAGNPTTVTNLGRVQGQSLNNEPFFDDATVTIYLNTSTGINETHVACDSFTWRNSTYTASGTYTYAYTNSSGAPAIDSLFLTILYSSSSNSTITICSSQLPYLWNGISITQSGTFTKAGLTNAAGCDSTAILNLNVVSINAGNDASVCQNTPVQLNASGALVYSWSPATGLNNPNIPNPVANPATTTTYVVTGQVQTNNLIVNGNFSQGNTGFSSSYNFAFPNLTEGQYFVGPNGQAWNPGMAACGDHTTGSGNMLLVNGSTVPNVTIYCQTVSVQPNTNYEFSTWLVSLTTPVSLLQFSINGNLIGSTFSGSSTICQWKQFYSVWNSGNNTTATICIVNQNTSAGGNDFGLDDISFSALCTSIDSVTITVRPNTTGTTTAAVCSNNLPFSWNGVNYSQSGTYTKSGLTNAAGCDSTAILNLTVRQNTSSNFNVAVCPSQLPYIWNGLTFTQSGSQTKTLVNAAGCDSLATLNLTVKQNTSSNFNVAVCPNQLPYIWNGLTFTQSGSQTKTLVNAAGCDSLATLNLTVKQNSSSSFSVAVCPSQLPYIWNGLTFTQSGSQSVTLTNAVGCDSVATLNLSVNNISTSTTNVTICSNELPYSWNWITISQAGVYSDTLTNAAGCDSVATLNLTVNPVTNNWEDITICSSQLPYTWNGITFNQAGSQSVTLTSAAGCDSIVTLDLTVNPVTNSWEDITICSSQLPYTWNGITFNQAGSQSVTLTSVAGCDSIVTLDLTVNPVTNSWEDITICSSQLPYTWNGITFNQAGSQSVTLTSAAGCDSIVTLDLTVNSVSGSTTDVSVCSNLLPYLWNGLSVSQAGSQSVTLTNAAGCDSIAILNLSIAPATITITDTTICERDLPFVWNGNSYTQSANQSITLINSEGCDSILTLNLTVINCDPPCITENFNASTVGWTLSQGARIHYYSNPANNCVQDRGIITPGVGGNDPARVRTPNYTSSGAASVKVSFDIFVFDANLRCASWKNYPCTTSMDVYYYAGNTRYMGVADFVLPPNGPQNSPTVEVIIPVGNRLPAGVQYSVELDFKFKSGTGNCVQQNTKYVLDNFSVCERQCAVCPAAPAYSKSVISAGAASVQSVTMNEPFQEVKVWPVPGSGILNFESVNFIAEKIEVLDLSGRQLRLIPYSNKVDLSALPPGHYMVRVHSANGVLSKRIWIVR